MLQCTVCNVICSTAYHLATHLESHGIKTDRFLESFPCQADFTKFLQVFKTKYNVTLRQSNFKRTTDGRQKKFYHCKHAPVNGARCCPFFMNVSTELDCTVTVQGIVTHFGHSDMPNRTPFGEDDPAPNSPPHDFDPEQVAIDSETNSSFDEVVSEVFEMLTAIRNNNCPILDKEKLVPDMKALIEAARTLFEKEIESGIQKV